MNDIQEKQEPIEMDTEPEVPLLKPKIMQSIEISFSVV